MGANTADGCGAAHRHYNLAEADAGTIVLDVVE
jgi:hypothetical protein